MPFQKGNKLSTGGKRAGAGRKSREVVEQQKTAAEIARKILEENCRPIVQHYITLALEDAPTTRHFIDKILPNDQSAIPPAGVIQFIQFNDYKSVRLSAKEPVLLEAEGVKVKPAAWIEVERNGTRKE